MFSERRDHIQTFEKRARKKRVDSTNFFAKLAEKLHDIKQKLINDQIEEIKNERSEIKNFNRNFNAKKAQSTLETRMFMF